MARSPRTALTAVLLGVTLATTAPAALAAGPGDPPPGPVSGFAVTGTADSVTLAWTLPPDADLARVVVRRAKGTTTPPPTPQDGEEVASGLLTSWTDDAVDWRTPSAYAVFVEDVAGQWSAPRTAQSTVSLPITVVKATAGLTSITLTWSTPSDQRVAGLRIRTVSCQDRTTVERVVDVPRGTTTYVDDGLPRSTPVCYRTQNYAVDGRGASGSLSWNTGTWAVTPLADLAAAPSGDSVRLTWTLPDDPEASAVVIRRTGGPGDPAEGAVVHRGSGSSYLDTGLDAETAYTYRASVTTSAGAESPARTVAATTSLRWAQEVVAPDTGAPSALSCPRSNWCMSLDRSARYQVLDGSTWSAPRSVPTTSVDIWWRLSCPEVGWCMAYGPDGFQRYSGGAWAAAEATRQPIAGRYTAITCTSPTWCVAMTDNARASTFDGSSWTTPAFLTSLRGVRFTDISCQATRRCFAVGESDPAGAGYRATLSGGRWTTARLSTAGRPVGSIECPTTTVCVATSAWGTWTVSGTTWTARPDAAASGYHLACATSTFCLATDYRDRSVRWSGKTWGSPTTLVRSPGMITAMSCPRGATPCHAVDDRGRHYRWSPSTGWLIQTVYDETSGGLGRPSCISATECLAIDANGWLFRFDGTAWSRPSKPFVDATDLSCTRTGFCLGLQGTDGRYRTYRDGVWSTARFAPMRQSLGAPSCASASMCMVLDVEGRAWRFNGSTWSAAGSPFLGMVDAAPAGRVRCTGYSFCMAVAYNGSWARWTGSAWTKRSALPTGLTGAFDVVMDCSSSTSCLAVVDSGATAVWSGSSWTGIPGTVSGAGTRLADVDCVRSTWCVAVHPYSNSDGPVIWTGNGWKLAAPYGRPMDNRAVACPTSSACLVTGWHEAAWTVPATTPN